MSEVPALGEFPEGFEHGRLPRVVPPPPVERGHHPAVKTGDPPPKPPWWDVAMD